MDTTDHILLHRFVISRLAKAGLEPERLIRAAELPPWAIADDHMQVPSEAFSRIWEIAADQLDDPQVGARIGSQYRLGSVGLYDYLFSSKPTVGEGLATVGPYVSAVTTNHRFDLVMDSEAEATLNLTMINGADRGRELTHQWGLAAILTRARVAAAGPFDPIRMTFRQRAPRNHADFVEIFGTTAIEFDAPIDSMTFRAADLELPLATADPMLSPVLERLAAQLPPPPPLSTAWTDRVAEALALALAEGDPSLSAVSHRLATSPRTLQRRLAEAGTTWRQELTRARQQRTDRTSAGSLQRAARRWSITADARTHQRRLTAHQYDRMA